MIPGEWLESADLVPSGTQLGGRLIATDAADVGTDKGDAEDVELHGGYHRDGHVLNQGVVVAQPVGGILSMACEGGS